MFNHVLLEDLQPVVETCEVNQSIIYVSVLTASRRSKWHAAWGSPSYSGTKTDIGENKENAKEKNWSPTSIHYCFDLLGSSMQSVPSWRKIGLYCVSIDRVFIFYIVYAFYPSRWALLQQMLDVHGFVLTMTLTRKKAKIARYKYDFMWYL